MELGCIFSYINKIGAISNKFLAKRIKEEGLPILQNHSLLFYILPKDKSQLLFSEIVERGKISKSSLSDIINKYENLGLGLEKKENEIAAMCEDICLSLGLEGGVVKNTLQGLLG